MMVVLGLMLASVGQDSLSDITRFTFDNMNLTDGISFVLVVMATFAMSEALTIILKRNDPTSAAKQVSLTELGSIKINKEERVKMYKTIPRSSLIGFLIGVLPGAGATIASFLAYGMERNLVRDEEKEKFGKGSVNGLSAPETANNAACSGSFVPMLTLGIRKRNHCCYVGSTFRFWYSTWTKGVYDKSGNFLVSDNVNVHWNGYTINIKPTFDSLHY